MSTSPEKNIQSALVEFKNEEVSHDQLAKFIGFTEKEMGMLKIFWKPVFNRTWIYLSRDMIKEYFCKDDKSKDAVRNFLNRILYKKYDEFDDYEIYDTLELMMASEKVHSSKMTNGNFPFKNYGNRAKYVLVTGECFKMLSMERNKDIRLYYIKVEELCMLMKDYIQEISKHRLIDSQKQLQLQNTEHKEQLKEKTKEIENLTIHKAIFNQMAKTTQKTEEVYIITKKNYAHEFKFKIGISTYSSFARLKSLNTGNIKEDECYICHIEKCYNAKATETAIHKQLAKFRHDKEWFMFPFDLIKEKVIYEANNHNDSTDHTNTLIDKYNDMLNQNTMNVTIPDPMAPNYKPCRLLIENGPDKIVLKDLSDLSDDARKQYIDAALKLYGIDMDDEKENPKIVIWKDYKLLLLDQLTKENYNSKRIRIKPWKRVLRVLYDFKIKG